HYELAKHCLVALEECVLRFPQHYKSLYRLTHFYFHSKFHRNISKCQDLLLGTYKCLTLEERPASARFQGLFAERKNNNFFNGVWRIPVSEIDRPGSFASHMSRCVLLLMEVLREIRDHRMLLELCLQLRRTPEADKKYLRDSEREQLCRQALTLALQALRAKLREGPITSGLVVEMYRAYQRVQRYLPQKESVFASLLSEAYKQHAKVETAVLDQVIRFSQQEIIASRAAAHAPVTAPVPTTVSQPVTATPPTVTGASTNVTTHQQRKTVTPIVKPAVSSNYSSTQSLPRSRGRPLNVHVSGTIAPHSSKSQYSSSRCSIQKVPPQQFGPIIPQNMSTPTLPYYPFHTLFSDPSLITAAVQSKAPAMLDQQVAALNFLNLHAHIGGYQAEFLRHFSTSTGSVAPSVIPSIPSSQRQKESEAVKSHESSSVGNKGISALANPQCTQKPSTSLPTSISITPLPPAQSLVPCNSSPSTSPLTTKYRHSKNNQLMPSLQQKLQASQALAKSASNRSSVSNVSLSVSKASSQVSTSVAQLPLKVTASPYTPPKDQVLFSPQPQKPSNPNPYISLLKGGEGMLTAGVSISQVTSTPVSATASTKPSTSKLMNFRKCAVSPSQGNETEDQTGVSKDVMNITPPFKHSHSGGSKMPGRSDCSRDIASRMAAALGPRNQSSGCKLSTTSATGPSIKSGQTQMIAVPRSANSGIGQDLSIYKDTQTTPKTSNPFVQRSEISESAVTKNKSPENKDLSPSSIYKNQSGTKGCRSPIPLRKIGHEITVTPSNSAASSICMLSRLHQQSSELEVIAKPPTLDLPVTIPSSITITAKQQGTSDGNFSGGQQGRQGSGGGDCFRSSAKKFKDSVSITEIGRKLSTGSQGSKRIGGPSAVKQKEQKMNEKHGSTVGDSVEVITLE
ncbi:mucin-17-like, partial [Zootermopsis nevadensis]